jgi:DNA-binding CsgD family transcriptional regulator
MRGLEGAGILGREVELVWLARSLGGDSPIAVVGEAGIGKTSLIRTAAEQAELHLLEGGGFATLAKVPYLSLQRAVGEPLAGDAATVATLIEGRVGPDLLFVDDLHAVDRETRAVLELLTGRIAIAMAIREFDPGSAGAIDLATGMGSTVLRLSPIDASVATELVQRMQPDLPAAAVERIVAGAGGNPLLLEELAHRGGASPTLARAIVARLGDLGPESRRAAERLAVAGRPLPMAAIGVGVEGMVAGGLATTRDGAIELRHALVAEAIVDGMTPEARRATHADLASMLEDPAEIARHLAAAGRGQEAAAIALAAVTAAADARTAANLLVIAATSDPTSSGSDLRLQAANALDRISDREAVLELLADDPGDASPELLAEREALLARASYDVGRPDEARAHLGRARAMRIEPGSPAAARVALEAAAFAVNVDGAVTEALALLDSQIPHHGPLTPEHWSLRSIREGILLAAGHEPDLALLQQAIAGALAAGQSSTAADLVRIVAFALLMYEGADAGTAFLRSSLQRFVGPSAAGSGLEVAAELAVAEQVAGRLAEAVTAGDEVLERPAPRHARQIAAIHRARALAMLGRHEAAAEGLVAIGPFVTDDWFGRGEYLAAQADIALMSGRSDRAVGSAEAAMLVPAPISGGHLLAAVTRAWAQSELGMSPDIDVAGEPTPSLAGARPELAGIHALHAGDSVVAAAAFREAASLWHGFNEPRSVTCRWAAGEASRRAGDADAARSLEEALEATTAMGFEALGVRVRRSLRLAGIRVPSLERSDRRAPLQLTRRERELLRLAGDGLSNIEIARRVGLGRPTVSRILSNAMAKLGADSRAQAVAMASDHD